MMKNVFYRLAVSLLIIFSIVSCDEKPSYYPAYDLENTWALLETDGTTSSIYEFRDGRMFYYEANPNAKYIVADNAVWGCSRSDFECVSEAPYSVRGRILYFGEGFGESLGELNDNLNEYSTDYTYYESCMNFYDGSMLVLIENYFQEEYDGAEIPTPDPDPNPDPTPDPTPEPTPEPELEKSGWGIVGTINNWGENGEPDIPLYVYEEFYVALDVYLTTSDELKFRKNNDWSTHLTFLNDYPVEFNSGYYLADGFDRSNIKVSQSGYYDVYMLDDLSAVYFMQQGYMPDIR